jgi:hypothetical protein
MVTWYVLCDPTLKGELLVQWRMEWKKWGSKFRYGNVDPEMRKKYGFGQWGYVKTEREYKEGEGVHLMGWSYKEIWGTPKMWDMLKTQKIDWREWYVCRNWYMGLMIRWRQVMCLYFYMQRVIHWKWRWQRYISE